MDSELTLLRLMPPGFCALTGAGSGTSAGIPDYRDESGRWKHAAEPLTYGEFVGERPCRGCCTRSPPLRR